MSAAILGATTQAAAVTPPQTVYLDDAWPEANGTNLNAKAPAVGLPWSVLAGAWTVQSHKATTSTGAGQALVAADSLHGDGVITCPITFGVNPGIAFRLQDVNNFMLFTADGSLIRLWEVVTGSANQLGQTFSTWNPAETHTIQITLSGLNITVIDDLSHSVTIVTNRFQTATKHGMRSFNDATSVYGEFKMASS